jgi:hypothetical protein
MADELGPITDAELAEARTILEPTEKPESFTCFDCVGRRLRSECPEAERASWDAGLRAFNPQARTLCALAWDPYNTNGDCLASK